MEYKLPLWMKNIDNSLGYDNLYIIHGQEVRDSVILPKGLQDGSTVTDRLVRDTELQYSELEFKSFDDSLEFVLKLNGFDAIIRYDVNAGYQVKSLNDKFTDVQIKSELSSKVGGILENKQGDGRAEFFKGLHCLIDALDDEQLGSKVNFAVVVDYFSETDQDDRLMDSHPNLEQAMLASFQHSKRKIAPFLHTIPASVDNSQDEKTIRVKHPLFWILRDTSSLHTPLLSGIGIRQIPISTPSLEDRITAVGSVCTIYLGATYFDEGDAKSDWDKQFEKIAKAMSGLSLRAIEEIINSRRKNLINGEQTPQKFALEIIELAKEYRVGLTENPWGTATVRARINDGENILKTMVKGQDYAVKKSVNTLKLAALNLTSIDSKEAGTSPRGVLFFAGPTGVGKTELSKSIAKMVFGSEDDMIRFDMSEFNQGHSDARLVGAPPGYRGHEQGGELTNAVKKKPFSVVLFDEIEKADKSIFDKFLQILSDGRLTDGRGDTAYFTESIIIFTSNKGVAEMQKFSEENPNLTDDEYRGEYRKHIEKFFRDDVCRPEIYGRIDEANIIVFNAISETVGKEIAKMNIQNIISNIYDLNSIIVDISENAMNQILQHVTTSEHLKYGGRGIKNALKRVLTTPLAQPLIEIGQTELKSINILELRDNGDFVELEYRLG